ncbi:MAG: hypothetical protein M5U27_00025 [Gaiella sp.]|nr:hypothetical protein [Gaiella sp.]
MDAQLLHRRLVAELQALRQADGGLPASAGGPSEVEPTAVAALVLRSPGPEEWLRVRQRPDGGFGERDGRPDSPTVAALAALVLSHPNRARSALRYAIERRGLPLPNAKDPDRRVAWGWTDDARSLVEPTARVLLAVKRLDPSDRATRLEALRLFGERQCASGGWNYGNASVYDVDLRAYAQTTAVALIALQGEDDALTGPGIGFLRRAWRREPGGLTAAQALVAFRLHAVHDEVAPAVDHLAGLAARPSFRERPLGVAWAALATGPDELLEPLRPSS